MIVEKSHKKSLLQEIIPGLVNACSQIVSDGRVKNGSGSMHAQKGFRLET
jgi:hypothetical protein